jgi:hypothetical protein
MMANGMFDRIHPIAIRLLRGELLRLKAGAGNEWTATAIALTEDGEQPFIESDAFEVARAIVVMELRDVEARH